ncbi:capsule biosynthesis protein, partial [Salmonella enterica subsp. enterica serovar Typhi]|nr:capsule biosynthesis protein [Salmonella enterica subsp. enterica serovar Typhi]
RAENRLSGVRAKLTELRNREQAVSPDQIASVKVPVIAELERQLAELKIRRTALTSTLSSGESPAMRVIDRQIEALSQQLAEQRALIGTGTDSEGNPGSLSGVVAEYTQLTVDEQFATQAYTTALASLETALAEAQKKQRYFATFVAPYSPDASIYPQRMLNTILAFLTLSVFWLIGYFMVRSVYDHAV